MKLKSIKVLPAPAALFTKDNDLEKSGYPLSNLGKNIEIKETSNKWDFKTLLLATIFIIIPVLIPLLLCISFFAYKLKPEIHLTDHCIEGLLCPKCQIGQIKLAWYVNSCVQTKTNELFICSKCHTIYPETHLDKYF